MEDREVISSVAGEGVINLKEFDGYMDLDKFLAFVHFCD